MIAYNIIVTGVVQGVGFRHYCRACARELGVCGTVENLTDGSVEIHVEGIKEEVLKFLEWCHTGPTSATVNQLHYKVLETRGLVSFDILRK